MPQQQSLSALLRPRREHRTKAVMLLWPPTVHAKIQALVDELDTSVNELVLRSLQHTLDDLAEETGDARVQDLVTILNEMMPTGVLPGGIGNRGNRGARWTVSGGRRRKKAANEQPSDGDAPTKKEGNAA